jgi:hypothetical protein
MIPAAIAGLGGRGGNLVNAERNYGDVLFLLMHIVRRRHRPILAGRPP